MLKKLTFRESAPYSKPGNNEFKMGSFRISVKLYVLVGAILAFLASIVFYTVSTLEKQKKGG
ncbi:MAG: hypothetical protein ACE5EK_06405, partial [Nitrospinales bacterium]